MDLFVPKICVIMKDPGNNRGKAKKVGILDRAYRFNDSVSQRDKKDFYQFSINNSSSTKFTLRGLKSNANLALFNQDGQRIEFSRRGGRKSEKINRDIDPGTYFVEVSRRGGRTSYRLKMRGKPLPSAAPTPVPAPEPVPSPAPSPPPSNTVTSNLPETAVYSITATGITFSGDTFVPTQNTNYTEAERFTLPGNLTISPQRFAQNGAAVEVNERDIGLFVGNDVSLTTAGTLRYGTHTWTHEFWGGLTAGRPPLDTAVVGINEANGIVVADVDPNWARNDTTNLFSWRSNILSAPKQILGGTTQLQFANGGQSVSGSATFVGNGFIEPGAFAYTVEFTGTRIA